MELKNTIMEQINSVGILNSRDEWTESMDLRTDEHNLANFDNREKRD